MSMQCLVMEVGGTVGHAAEEFCEAALPSRLLLGGWPAVNFFAG